MMHRSRRGGLLATVSVALVTMAACAPMRVNSFLERGASLSQYRSYDWAGTDRLSTGDPRLDNNPFFLRRLQSSVETGLASRGLQKTTDGTSDVIVHYHASVTQQLTVSGLEQDDLRCDTPPCSPDVYDKGSIVLDLVDRGTNKLVWRGWATTAFDNIIDNQRLFEETVDEAVRQILDRLPPSGA